MQYKKYFKNKSDYITRRKNLRRTQTKAEYVLWQELRRKALGYTFRRQFQIGIYIVDFYCHELKLIIELDGPIHERQKEYDEKRQGWLERQGFLVLRFKNDEVLFERERILDEIGQICYTLVRS